MGCKRGTVHQRPQSPTAGTRRNSYETPRTGQGTLSKVCIHIISLCNRSGSNLLVVVEVQRVCQCMPAQVIHPGKRVVILK